MRRSDRELTDRVEIDGILDLAAELRLGLWDGQEVYVVPLNFVRIGDALFFIPLKEQTFSLGSHILKP